MSIAAQNPGILPPALAEALAPGASASMGPALSAWGAAMAIFETRRSEEAAYDEAVWMPAYHTAEARGPRIPDHIDAEMDRLIEERCEAEEALIKTAAPDLSAVIWKMEYANNRWEGFCGWPDDWWNAVIEDLRGFAGGAA